MMLSEKTGMICIKCTIFLFVCTVAFSMASHAQPINPDGRAGHVSFRLNASWIRQEDFFKFLTPDLATQTFVIKDGADTSAITNGGFRLIIPSGRNVTLVMTYDYCDFHGMPIYLGFDEAYTGKFKNLQKTIALSINYYSRGTDDVADLVNPDGIPRSVGISPAVGAIFSSSADRNGVAYSATGLLCGLRLAAVATKHLTLVASFDLERIATGAEDPPRPQSIVTTSLGYRYHFNNRVQSASSFNPDGSPGTISIAPNLGYVNVGDREYGYTSGAEMTIPLFKHASVNLNVQYTSVKVRGDNYGFYFSTRYRPSLRKCTQLDCGIGFCVHI